MKSLKDFIIEEGLLIAEIAVQEKNLSEKREESMPYKRLFDYYQKCYGRMEDSEKASSDWFPRKNAIETQEKLIQGLKNELGKIQSKIKKMQEIDNNRPEMRLKKKQEEFKLLEEDLKSKKSRFSYLGDETDRISDNPYFGQGGADPYYDELVAEYNCLWKEIPEIEKLIEKIKEEIDNLEKEMINKENPDNEKEYFLVIEEGKKKDQYMLNLGDYGKQN